MEEQKVTVVVAVKIKKENAIGIRRKFRRGQGRKMREGLNERNREEEYRDKKREDRK